MAMDKQRLIICAGQGQNLGELIFDHDLFCEAILYPAGEERLGGWLQDWQTAGINYYHPEVSDSNNVCTIGESVNMRDPIFPSALRQWLENRGCYSFILPESGWRAWSMIQELPLQPEEKLKLGLNLSQAGEANLQKITSQLKSVLKQISQNSTAKSSSKHKE